MTLLRLVCFSLLFSAHVFAEGLVKVTKQGASLFVETVHGNMLVTEPLLIDLIQSNAFERLKHIRQHGTADFNHPTKKIYHRYDHSLGVMVMLAKHGGDLKTQATGLLHDISHTAFSHAADPLFMGSMRKGAYQDKIHTTFLKNHGIESILSQYNLRAEDMDPEHNAMLDQPSPKLCGDRLEYNLITGVIDGNFSKQDQEFMEQHLFYEDGRWFFDDTRAAKILALNSIWETENRWGSADSILTAIWTSEILAEALRQRLVTSEEIEYTSVDDDLWKRFEKEGNPYIQNRIKWIKNPSKYFEIHPSHKKAKVIHAKYRAIDPLIKIEGEFKTLSEIDPEFKKKFEDGKKRAEEGWTVIFKNGARTDMDLT